MGTQATMAGTTTSAVAMDLVVIRWAVPSVAERSQVVDLMAAERSQVVVPMVAERSQVVDLMAGAASP